MSLTVQVLILSKEWDFFSLSVVKGMLPKGSVVGHTSMRNSAPNSLEQNQMLHALHFFRADWTGLRSLFKLEMLLFHSYKFILVPSSLAMFLYSFINYHVHQSAKSHMTN